MPTGMQDLPIDSPHESELEVLFAWNAEKYLASPALMRCQIEVPTPWGTFRPDFIATAPDDSRVVFECDGADVHNAARDDWRDAMILGSSSIHAIYRLPGAALFHHIEDCFYLLSVWQPSLFTSGGKLNLHHLSSEAARDAAKKLSYSHADVYYARTPTSPPHDFRIERHSLDAPLGDNCFYRTAFNYAQHVGLMPLDEVIRLYRESPGPE